MTDRTITLTPTEAEKFQALAVGESMWIVREGYDTQRAPACKVNHPPVEFVQACAPCETCGGSRLDDAWCGTVCRDMGCTERECPPRCSECKLAVHPPCRRCGGGGQDTTRIIPTQCFVCSGTGRGYPLGYAYAVGQPLLVSDEWPDKPPAGGLLFIPTGRAAYHKATRPTFWPPTDGPLAGTEVPFAAFAHYDLATLPGQWAIEVRKA